MSWPVSYVVQAPRMREMAAWLQCNDIDPSEVPYPSPVFVETPDGEQWFVRFETYVRAQSGVIVYDEVGERFVQVVRSVPLVNDPPMGWLVEAAPNPVRAASAGPTGAESPVSDHTVAKSDVEGG